MVGSEKWKISFCASEASQTCCGVSQMEQLTDTSHDVGFFFFFKQNDTVLLLEEVHADCEITVGKDLCYGKGHRGVSLVFT